MNDELRHSSTAHLFLLEEDEQVLDVVAAAFKNTIVPVDQFGERTPTWEMLRQVNLQIHRLGPTYLQLKSVHVFHTPDVPPGTSGLESSRFMDEVGGGPFAVGEFEAPGGQPHIIVVNKDLVHSARLTVHFKEKGPVLRTSPYSGQTAPVGSEDNWLAPGQGALLALG